MPAPVLMGTMVSMARERANQETLDPSQALATDDELVRIGNSHLEHIWRALVRARGANYYETSTTFSTVPGTDTYTLPVDLVELVALDWVRSANDTVRLLPYGIDERNRYKNSIGWVRNVRNARIYYRLSASSLTFIPTPSTAETIRITYAPAFVGLTLGQSFDGVAGFEDYAVWRMAAYLAMKDENGALVAMCNAEADRVYADIVALGDRRDLGGPPRVQRTRALRRGRSWDDL